MGLNTFFEEHSHTRQQLDSFNTFLSKTIPIILQENSLLKSEMDSEFELKYTNPRIESPNIKIGLKKRHIHPAECRMRDLTYSVDILVDVEYKVKGKTYKKRSVLLGK